MYFKSELDLDALPSLITPFTAIVGWETWRKRADNLQRWLTENPLLKHYIADRHSLELTFLQLIRYRQSRGRLPRDIHTSEQYKLYSFMATLLGVYQRLNQRGKNRLQGMLHDGLRSDDGLVPLQHEMETIAHLLRAGFDVEPVDLERGSGFDFLATKESAQAEIECKTVSADLGRPVHHRQMVELSKHIFPLAKHTVESTAAGVLVTITLSGRLTGRLELHQRIASAVDTSLQTRKKQKESDFSVSIEDFSLAGSSFGDSGGAGVNQEQLQNFVESQFGKANKHLFVYLRPRVSAVIIVVESTTSDKVLDGIYRPLKQAARKQFTKTRPAMLVVRLSDLAPGQLFELATKEPPHGSQPNGLQLIASRLLDGADRAHLHTVAYISRGGAEQSAHVAGGRTTRIYAESGHSYVFTNTSHPMANDPRLSIFT